MTVWWQLRPFLLIIGCSQVLFRSFLRAWEFWYVRVDAINSNAKRFPFLCDSLYKVYNGRFRRGIDAVESSAASIGTGGEEN